MGKSYDELVAELRILNKIEHKEEIARALKNIEAYQSRIAGTPGAVSKYALKLAIAYTKKFIEWHEITMSDDFWIIKDAGKLQSIILLMEDLKKECDKSDSNIAKNLLVIR